eukprot:GEMP01023645.1.p1 GENE.GEMP01023645.1~~GEMP01023645.1.p1  ORF type:complete len:642 (+),score=165.82 GEMP01023645.1:33-1958(+)
MEDAAFGPFRLPHGAGDGAQGAIQLFHLRDIERMNEELEKKKRKTDFKVHEKTTSNSRSKGVARHVATIQHELEAKAKAKAARKSQNGVKALGDKPGSPKALKTGGMAAGPSRDASGDGNTFLTEPAGVDAKHVEAGKGMPAILDVRARREVMNTRDFVRKKREVFLVQMSLDVTKAEVLKLEESVQKREEALKKSQAMLDEDVTRFEIFLNTNDRRAREARKNVETMTKKKTEKQGRIKQLKNTIAQIESEIAKLHELQLVSNRYEDFLNRLTPGEWKEEQKQKQLDFLNDKESKWIEERQREYHETTVEPEYERLLAEFHTEMDNMKGRLTSKAYEEEYKTRLDLVNESRDILARQFPSIETLKKQWQTREKPNINVPDPEQYFKEPKQLMDILLQLEERNLFFIQDAQEIEESIDDVNVSSKKQREESERKINELRRQISNLERVTNADVRKTRENAEKLRKEGGTETQDKKIEDLKAKIKSVYSDCGFESDHDSDPIQMLGSIESKLEELLTFIDGVEKGDPRFAHINGEQLILRLERHLELERRQRWRKERLDEEARKQEKRLKASLKRSQAPVFKRVGKQIMFRSAPLTSRKMVVVDNTEDMANEEHRRLFGFYMDKEGMPQTELTTDKCEIAKA